MPLLSLANELLFQIARCLLCCPTCDSHHITADLSALSRCNHRLHALLGDYLLQNPSTRELPLLWSIANIRTDAVALALARGADPTAPLSLRITTHTSRGPLRTAVDLAICMRAHSPDAASHAAKLATLALLFGAGATCTINDLIMPTRYGDLDLLALGLAHLADADDMHPDYTLRTLLEVAARRGHVDAAEMTIAAGATVNSTGEHNGPGFYPPLWICWQAPLAVVQVLLDAGADPAWRARHGVSVVQNMRERAGGGDLELEEKVALLVRYGAVDQRPLGCGPARVSWVRPGRRRRFVTEEREYRGWVPESSQKPVDWVVELARARREAGCILTS